MEHDPMPPPDVSRIHTAIGLLQSQVQTLSDKIDEINEKTLNEQRKVHDIVDATSEAVRNLTRMVNEMRPLVDDYREKRAEARGAAKLAKFMYPALGMVGGWVAYVLSRLSELFPQRPH